MGRGVAAVVCWLVALGALAGAAHAQPLVPGGTAADLVINIPQADGDNLTILENDAGNSPTMSQVRSAAGTFDTTTFTHPSNSLTINLGDDVAESLSVTDDSVGVPIAVNGGGGANILALANGETLASGQFAGAGGTDTLDYSAYTTAVRTNLGASVPTLTATLGGDQETPPTASPATGTATVDYDAATGLLRIDLVVDGLDTATLTAFHIASAPIGVGGTPIVDLVPLLPGGPPPGTHFEVHATGVSLPPQQEAALLAGATYVNVVTTTLPGGAVRGQLLPAATAVDVASRTTGLGAISGVERVLGGAGADSLVGSNAGDTLRGGGGADTIVPARGADIAGGGLGADLIAWSDGDGSDTLDGDGDVDRVQVNGARGGTGDVFSVGASGTRVALARTAPGPFTLDIGSTEKLAVAANDDADALTSTDLSGIADLDELAFHGGSGDDTATIAPSPSVDGVARGGPGADTLRFDPGCLAVTTAPGSLTAAGLRPVTHASVETVDVASAVSFSAASGSFTEASGQAVIGVTRRGTAAGTVGYVTTALTATAGRDYTTTAGTLTFGGGPGSGTITVPLSEDAVIEGPETFQVELQSPGPFAHLCSPTEFAATIIDTTPPPPPPPPPVVITPPPPPPAVPPAPPPPPPPAATRFAITAITPAARTGTARVTMRLPRRGNVSIVARQYRRTLVVGRASVSRRGPGVVRATLRPTTAGRRLLRRTGRLRTTVTATFRPSSGGARSTAKRTTTLRLRR